MAIFLRPWIDVSNKAILAKSKAFPPKTAKNWNPSGIIIMPRPTMPSMTVVSILLFLRRRAETQNQILLKHIKTDFNLQKNFTSVISLCILTML